MRHKPIGNIDFILDDISIRIPEFDNLQWEEYDYLDIDKSSVEVYEYDITKSGENFLKYLQQKLTTNKKEQ